MFHCCSLIGIHILKHEKINECVNAITHIIDISPNDKDGNCITDFGEKVLTCVGRSSELISLGVRHSSLELFTKIMHPSLSL